MAGEVHLTFDDGPDPVWTAAVLDALDRSGARATFFPITRRVERHPALIESIRARGHEVGLHCHRHVRHSTLTRQQIERDTDTALEILAALGVHPTRWRLPWGVSTPASAAVARDRRLALLGWTADSEDWRGVPAATMLARIRPDLRAGAVVLAHDGLGPGALRASCAATVELVEPLVDCARSAGLHCAPPAEAVVV